MDIENTENENNLEKERKNCIISSDIYKKLIFDENTFKNVQFIINELSSLNSIKNSNLIWTQNTRQEYLHASKAALDIVNIIKKHNLIDKPELCSLIQAFSGIECFINLHLTMFIPGLQSLASDEQLAFWLPLAKNFRILGTYAQTEISHGSYVQGLQTTAIFDVHTDKFVVNTPHLRSYKFWPGGLAKSCTHCILMARLIIKDIDYGIHPFIFQIRDVNTHKTLNGIHLTHIGKKLGYNSMDNGCMQIKNVCISRQSLLNRYSNVDKYGNYTKQKNQKMLYATMTYTRKQIIFAAGINLAKTIIIAIRYSVLRKQFPDQIIDGKASENETSILNYSTQQFMLFPILSISIAFLICGRWVNDKYNDFMDNVKKGDLSDLSEIHCLTSSLKAFMTMTVLDKMEICRKACGGHGYLISAGIALHLSNYLPQATYEGDFVVLSIQTGRLLLKAVQKKMTEKYPKNIKNSSMLYIYNFDPFSEHNLTNFNNSQNRFFELQWISQALKLRSNTLIYKTANTFQNELSTHNDMLKALESVKIEFTLMTKAHANVLIFDSFQNYISQFINEPALYEISNALCNLYGLYWIYESFGEFIMCNAINGNEFEELMSTIKILLNKIRPHSVGLTDAFNLPNYFLNSVLGEYEGNVYERLYESMNFENANESDVHTSYYQFIQYILHPERKFENISKL